jgi:hypothetical protein
LEHGFPLIRSLRASAQRSTSVLFSFVLSLLIVAGSFRHPAIKNDFGAAHPLAQSLYHGGVGRGCGVGCPRRPRGV